MMDIAQAIEQILSLSGLPTTGVSVDASLFRLGTVNVNLGLINTDRLSIQVRIDHNCRSFPVGDTEHRKIEDKRAEAPVGTTKQDVPIEMVESPFEVTSTFRFGSDSVFDQSQGELVINGISLHFARTEGQLSCDLRLDRPFRNQRFLVRDGRPFIEDGFFPRYDPCEQESPRFSFRDGRVVALVDKNNGVRFYKNSRGTMVGIFPADTGVELPLGKDNAEFSGEVCTTVHLICVATPRNENQGDSLYRIRSYFYIATGAGKQ